MAQLASTFADAKADVQNLVAETGARLWDTLPGHDDRDVATFLARALPVVAAGQRRVIALTDAYVGLELGRAPLGIDVDLGELRAGASPDEVYRRPFVTLWTGLKDGKLWDDANAAARARLVAMIQTDVALAMTHTLRAIGEADSDIIGWRRVIHGTCDLCEEVIGEIIGGTVLQPIHPGCECVSEPVRQAAKQRAKESPAMFTNRMLAERLAREQGQRVVSAPKITPQLYGEKRMMPDVAFPSGLRAAKPVGSFTEADYQALNDWVIARGEKNSFIWNPKLRTGEALLPEQEKLVAGIDRALDHAGTIGEPFKAYREIGRSLEEVGNFGVDDTVVDDAFGAITSDLKRAEWAKNYADNSIFEELTIDPRVRAIYGFNPEEGELLLERGCRYVIESMKKEGNRWIMKATVLPPE